MACHDRGVEHCDVKMDNVLICEEETPLFKMSEFSLAVCVVEDGLIDDSLFTPQFPAPELQVGGRCGMKVDLWFLVLIMYGTL